MDNRPVCGFCLDWVLKNILRKNYRAKFCGFSLNIKGNLRTTSKIGNITNCFSINYKKTPDKTFPNYLPISLIVYKLFFETEKGAAMWVKRLNDIGKFPEQDKFRILYALDAMINNVKMKAL
jgi:hypothetical protein